MPLSLPPRRHTSVASPTAAGRWVFGLWATLSLAAVALHAAASLGEATARLAVVTGALAALLHVAVWRNDNPCRRPVTVLALSAIAWTVLVLLPPVLSDDVWRYLLDGQTTCRGVSPFAYPPASAKVTDWVSGLPHAVNHPHLPTIYPPVAQGVFAAVACLGGGLVALKALFAAAWWGAAFAFSRPAPLQTGPTAPPAPDGRLSPRFVAAVCHPLPLFAIAGDGHVDAVGLLLLAFAVAGMVRQRATWAIVGVAGAAAVKLFPLLLLFAGAAGQASRRLWWAIAAAGLLVALWIPLAPATKLAPGSTATFATTWVHQPALASFVQPALIALLARAEVPTRVGIDAPTWLPSVAQHVVFPERPTAHGLETTRWVDHPQWAALATRVLGGLLLGIVLWRSRAAPTRQAVGLVTTTLLLCLPVVHPWYVLWAWLPILTATRSDSVSPYLKQYVSLWGALALLGWWGAASVADGGPWVDKTATLAIWHGLPAVVVACTALQAKFRTHSKR